MNPRRRWVWVGYWGGVALLAMVLLGVSGQVLSLEGSEARGRAETARQEASRLALWRMDSWLAPVLAREGRRPYFEYRAVLPAGRAYEHMWAPIPQGEPIVASALVAGVPENEQITGPSGEGLIRLHLQIEPDGSITSPQHPSDAELVHLVLTDPLVEANAAGRDRAGALLSVLPPMAQPPVVLGNAWQRDGPAERVVAAASVNEGLANDSAGARAPDYLYDQSRKFEVGEYEARSQVAQLAQQVESPQQQVYTANAANRLDDPSGFGEATAGAADDAAGRLATDTIVTDDLAGSNRAPATELSKATSRGVAPGEDALEVIADAAGAEVPASDVATETLSQDLALESRAEEQARRRSALTADSRSPADAPGGVGYKTDYEAGDETGDGAGDALRLNSDFAFNNGFASSGASGPVPTIRVGALRPRWLQAATGEPELLYLRDVHVEGKTYQQGVWFDWPALRGALLAVSPGLPSGTTIDPVTLNTVLVNQNPQQQLATVPAVLRLPPIVRTPLGMTPARWSLVLTWAAVLASVGAIGVVLRTAMRLSDRRVRFVGAVTHELRTPLTTFRLYSQMLADGMVTEEGARREYLNTLKQESGRLAGIVENVLAYARLNRAGRDQQRVRTEVTTPEALLVRVRPGLSRRAEQSGMDLIVSNEAGPAGDRELMVDPQSVERVLTNLVDNACKYAAPTGDDDPHAETRVHLDMRVVGENLEILVADYGPGIDSSDRGKVFGEFQRGRAGQRADRSGLGLGLALSRGLARESGGDLRLIRRRGHGAEFLLTLPMQPGA